MEKQNLRVMVAAERPRVRKLFKTLAMADGNSNVVGEAKSASEVLTLARDVKPDVVVMDLYLPCGGPNAAMCGLDAAQALTNELSGSLVVLVTNSDDVASPHGMGTNRALQLVKECGSGPSSMALGGLYRARRPSMPVFAGIGSAPVAPAGRKKPVQLPPPPSVDDGGALFYTLGVIALCFFFSPFVLIYFMVKAVNRMANALHSSVSKVEVANEFGRGPEDIPHLLHT